jgi:CheY-like chemotaxis protein
MFGGKPLRCTVSEGLGEASVDRPILLVDDDERTGQALKDLLEQHGHAVVYISGGVEALHLLSAKPDGYSLVCCDVLMAEMDGFEVLKQAHDNPATAHVPFLMLGAHPADVTVDDVRAWQDNGFAGEFLLDGRHAWVVKHNIHNISKQRRLLLNQDILRALEAVLKRNRDGA